MKKIMLMLALIMGLLSAVTVGEVPKKITLEGKNGSKVNSEAWHSSMLKDKVFVLFYVDPDEKDMNNDFSGALKKKSYDLKSFGTVAVINMKATWLPDVIIKSLLEAKQEEYPTTTYVKDMSKYLVEEWDLKDDSSNVLIFNKVGELIYYFSGKMEGKEIIKALRLIEEAL